MCSPDSTATIKTPDSKPTRINQPMGDAPKPTGTANNFGFSAIPPADAPDLTDKVVRSKRLAQALQLTAGRGRKQSFLGGGDYGSTPLGGGSILGGS